VKLATFMSIASVLALLFGLAFLLAPVPVSSVYGVALEPNGAWLGRYLGAALLGVGLLTWLARNARQGEGLRAIILGLFVLSAISLVLAVLHALSGLANALAWSTVIIYLFLTLGFGYFQFVKPVSS
jgi:hypothetical protein